MYTCGVLLTYKQKSGLVSHAVLRSVSWASSLKVWFYMGDYVGSLILATAVFHIWLFRFLILCLYFEAFHKLALWGFPFYNKQIHSPLGGLKRQHLNIVIRRRHISARIIEVFWWDGDTSLSEPLMLQTESGRFHKNAVSLGSGYTTKLEKNVSN